jgi:hypothetical protein
MTFYNIVYCVLNSEKLTLTIYMIGGAFSSILNWVALSSTTPSLLPRAACPEYPWLALYVLDVEQDENETRTGLWQQLLIDFADSNKLTLDQALKVT